MAWSYSEDPSTSTLDAIRFLVGDTDISDPLVQDEEINYAYGLYADVNLASAYVLMALASKFSRVTNVRVGAVSESGSDIAKAFRARAEELDPGGVVTESGNLALPSFGGRSKSEKDTLNSDTDAVQPSFFRDMDDIPDGPSDNVGDDVDWIR